MKAISRKQIGFRVREYVTDMKKANPNYPNEVPHDVIITEIMQRNGWFTTITEPAEMIREEVERQFDKYVRGKHE